MLEFNHISDVWAYLDQFKTPTELEKAFEQLPSKWGTFEITNTQTYNEDGLLEICNSYWDEQVGDYDYDYHCVMLNTSDLEAYKKDMLQALKKMQSAYKGFKNTLIKWDGVEKDFSKDYPFQYDLFDYNIEGWLDTSIKTIEEIDEEKFKKMSRGY